MEHLHRTIEDALANLRQQEDQVADTKKMINSLRKWAGQPPLFPDADSAAEAHAAGFRRDQFYGQPLSTVVRQILEARKAANMGPAAIAEVYDAMVAGGYLFDTSNAENAKRGLRISLTKNSSIFHKLPDGSYGLREWYPNIRPSKAKGAPTDGVDHEAEEKAFDFEAKEKEAENENKEPATSAAASST